MKWVIFQRKPIEIMSNVGEYKRDAGAVVKTKIRSLGKEKGPHNKQESQKHINVFDEEGP